MLVMTVSNASDEQHRLFRRPEWNSQRVVPDWPLTLVFMLYLSFNVYHIVSVKASKLACFGESGGTSHNSSCWTW